MTGGGAPQSGSRRRPRAAPLSREALVAATVRIADGQGSGAVTMRRLGAELGVDPTAVYRHFGSKDELLQAAADWLVAGAFEGYEPRGEWADDLRAMIIHIRRRYLRHPELLRLVATARGPVRSEPGATDRVLGMLRDGGLPPEDVVPAFEVLQDYLIGFTVLDAGSLGQSPDEWRRAFHDVAPAAYPHLAASVDALYQDAEARFGYGLDLLIESLERRRTR
ncbi:MAG: TetR/AcrR family transcriptional regulator [Chloroflexota bacterium]